MVSRSDIAAAALRLEGHVRHTPLLRLQGWEIGVRSPVALKLELLQYAGSFKPRGAFNRLLALPSLPARVIAASGGNHGAAVAYAARALGIAADIFVPETTPAAKVARIAGYGASVVRVGTTYADALAASRTRQTETGALEIHAYDHADVLAGQGTVGREFEHDAPDLTHVLVATGGGGLIGGLAADSLGARQVGGVMFPIAQAFVADAVLVPDDAITAAQTLLWDRARLLAEPGGATALAALLSGRFVPPRGARVGVLVCGANTDPTKVTT